MLMLLMIGMISAAFMGIIMADATVDGANLYFYDKWPGPVSIGNSPLDNPAEGEGHNVNVARAGLGTKIVVQNKHNADEDLNLDATFVYLKVGTQNADNLIAAKSVCIIQTAANPCIVTNNPDDALDFADSLCAVALTAMTDGNYGWFFCGGKVPSDLISGLDGTFPTDDSVVQGDFTTVNLTADAIGFGVIAATTSAVGLALAADA